jgi:asparagine synthase (glutamine-hydrolysing)
MCGIAGIINLKNNSVTDMESGNLELMLNSMLHRGPDGYGQKVISNCVFGMRRLSIIDIDGGQQPISNESDDVWVIMNGEIYNYIELREDLKQKGHKFKTQSDTEVLVHLYEEFGPDFVKKLNGMFAIFLFDLQKNIRFVFRDHIGIKPLFYFQDREKLVFSSDLNGLSKVVNTQVSEDAILSYMGLSYVAKPASIYQSISKLMPGCAISITSNEVKHYRYWSFDTNIDSTIHLKEAKEHIHGLLVESNKIQLRSDAEFAISLSGGIDSSLVLAYASMSYTRKLNTISIGYDGKADSQDMFYANLIAKKFETNHIKININKGHFLEYIEEILPYIDEPISDSALIPNYIISKEAKKIGIKVLLSGAGGDELFGGYQRHIYPSYKSARGLILYPSVLRKIGFSTLNKLRSDQNNLRLKYPKLAFASDINGLNYTYLSKILKPSSFKTVLDKTLSEYGDIAMHSDDYERSRMFNDARNYLVDNILSLSDKATMAASVEGRFPILDYRLVEYVFKLSNDIILLNNEPKGLLKEVIKPYVPHEILYRKKEGFNAPIKAWFKPNEIEKMKRYILKNTIQYLADSVNPDEFQRLILSNTENSSFENFYNLYFLNKWLDVHAK